MFQSSLYVLIIATKNKQELMTPLKLFLAYQLTIYMQWTSIWCTAAIISLDWHLNLNQGTTVAYVGDTVLWTWTDEYAHTVQSIGQPSFTSSITKTGKIEI